MKYDVDEINPEMKEILTFRNSVFFPLSLDKWINLNNKGIAIREDGDIIGILPLQERLFEISKNKAITIVNENNVCVAAGKRGNSVGSKLIDSAEEYYLNEYLSFNVFRFDESSPAYRFYRKKGHYDLCHKSLYSLKKEYTPSTSVKKLTFL